MTRAAAAEVSRENDVVQVVFRPTVTFDGFRADFYLSLAAVGSFERTRIQATPPRGRAHVYVVVVGRREPHAVRIGEKVEEQLSELLVGLLVDVLVGEHVTRADGDQAAP
jgi:hypothetical protein